MLPTIEIRRRYGPKVYRVSIPFSSGQCFLLLNWPRPRRKVSSFNPFFVRSMLPTDDVPVCERDTVGAFQSLFRQVNASYPRGRLAGDTWWSDEVFQSLFRQVNASYSSGTDRARESGCQGVSIPFSSGQCFLREIEASDFRSSVGSEFQSLFRQVNASYLPYIFFDARTGSFSFQSLFRQVNASYASRLRRLTPTFDVVSIPFSSGQCFLRPGSVHHAYCGMEVSIPFSSGQCFLLKIMRDVLTIKAKFQSLFRQVNASYAVTRGYEYKEVEGFNPFFVRSMLPTYLRYRAEDGDTEAFQSLFRQVNASYGGVHAPADGHVRRVSIPFSSGQCFLRTCLCGQEAHTMFHKVSIPFSSGQCFLQGYFVWRIAQDGMKVSIPFSSGQCFLHRQTQSRNHRRLL